MKIQRTHVSGAGRHRAMGRSMLSAVALLALFGGAVIISVQAAPSEAAGPRQTTTAARSATADRAIEPAAARGPVRRAATPIDAYSIWPVASTPTVQADPEDRWVQLGLRFRTAVDGWVTGIRFYKSALNTGTHRGYLWDGDGEKLASVTFTNETSSGWQTARFAHPVTILAGTVYTASYVAPHGRYASDEWALGTGRTVSQHALTALGSVYSYGQNLPTAQWRDSNYYVDVLFTTGQPAQPLAHAKRSRPVQRPTVGNPAPSTPPRSTATGSPTASPTRSTLHSTTTARTDATAGTTTRPPTTSSKPSSSTSPATPKTTTTTKTPEPTTTSASTKSTTASSSTRTTTHQTTSSPSTAVAPGGSIPLNCAQRPSACGYPDATNTGVPAGTTLKSVPGTITSGPGWHYDSRGWIAVDGDGAVLDGISTTASIDVTANNVTIRNSKITVRGEGWGIAARHTSNLVVKNNDISGPDNSGPGRLMVGLKDIYGDSVGMQVLANDIWNTSTGVQIESGLIRDNYIHDLGYTSGDHVNGITSNGGSRQLTIRHNTVFNPHDQTDAISLFQDFGPQANRTIADNLLAGGGYTIYAGANPGKESGATNIAVTDNRVARIYFDRGGSYGPATAYYTGGGNVWSGNIWDDSGKPFGY